MLYECLTGERAFAGPTFPDVMAAIVGSEPDWSKLPALPARVSELLRRTLAKDPRARLRDIGEARVLLQSGDLESSELAPTPRSRGLLLVSGGLLLGALLAGFGLDQLGGESASPDELATPPARVRTFAQPPALDEAGETVPWKETHISPNGNLLAVTVEGGVVVRSLDSLESTLISIEPRMLSLTWSPDSRFLAYIEDDTIVRVSPQGHSPVPLFSEPDEDLHLGSIAWLDDGRIVFGTMGKKGNSLRSIPEGGGPATEIAVISEDMISRHLHGITPVPGGRFVAVLHSFVGEAGYTILTEGDSGVRTLFALPGNDEDRASAMWAPGDYLLYSRGSSKGDETWAVGLSMDPFEVTGEPFFVQKGVTGTSVSVDGTLAYVEQGLGLKHELAWWSPGGKTEPIGRVHDKRILFPSLSNEQGSILYSVGNGPPMELWSYDLRRETSTELATGPGGALMSSTLPDGRITYSAIEVAEEGPFFQAYFLPKTGPGKPDKWLKGAVLGATESHALVTRMKGVGSDLVVYDRTSLEQTDFRIGTGDPLFDSISPDGKWALYLSAEGTNASELFLTRFPSGEGEWQVSIGGAEGAAFSPDGSAIHLVDMDRELYRVALQTEPELTLGTPELLGQAEKGTTLFCSSEDGTGRFLAMQESGSLDGELVVVLGWASKLAGR